MTSLDPPLFTANASKRALLNFLSLNKNKKQNQKTKKKNMYRTFQDSLWRSVLFGVLLGL